MPQDDTQPLMESKISANDREIANYIAEVAAARFMERIMHAAQSEEIADQVMTTWGGKIDRVIGRALRRLGGFVIIGLIGIGAFKLGLTEKLVNFLKL